MTKTFFLVATIVLAGIPAAFAGDIVIDRNHANCASPAMASCMSASSASEEFGSDEYAYSHRHAKRVAHQDTRARGSYHGTEPVEAPVAGRRGGDPLYESCDNPARHPEYSCPGVGAN